MVLVRAIERGTMPLISAARDGAPTAWSINRSSASLMPMWRAMNSLAFSSSVRVSEGDMASGVLLVGLVAGLVHQGVELGGQ